MVLLSLIIVVIFMYFSEGQLQDNLVISLIEPQAKIRGHRLVSFLGKEYYGFQDIPYAEPPIGDNRFGLPKPHSGWPGIINATENRKICKQIGRPESTEDCLVLNVYSPAVNSRAKFPVLFWLHGGSYISGSGHYENFNPRYFMDYGIIVVTINYRLGPFGFLTTGDGIIPGNLGLKDQQFALKWVNKNIAQFGGDPEKVTISGHSVGSTSVSHLVINQQSRGLYRAAIMQSSCALVTATLVPNPRDYAFQLGRLINSNFTSNDSGELLSLLKKASGEDIVTFSQQVKNIEKPVGILPELTWSIAIEGENDTNSLVKEQMHLALMNGHFDKVPIMIGFTSQEILPFVGGMDILRKNADSHDKDAAKLITPKWNIPIEDQSEVGEKLKNLYTNDTFLNDLRSFIEISNDIGISNPIIRQAQLSSQYVPTYMYQFSYIGASHRNYSLNIPDIDGVAHGEEIFYLWRMTSRNSSDRQTSQRLLKMWSNFVKYLNPTPVEDASLGIPIWPRMDSNKLYYMDINNKLKVMSKNDEYLGSVDILMQYFKPPYNVF